MIRRLILHGMRPLLLLQCLIAVPLVLTVAHAAGTPDDRMAAYHEFRDAFDKADYQDALPAAERVVEMTRSQFGKDAPENANALTNLGTTYYRLHQYGDALDRYRDAITVLELQNNPTDIRFVRALHGLGSALIAMKRQDEAIAPLKRAVDIVRNRQGLRAATQLPVLKTLIEGYVATGLMADADREHEYAFSVAEAAYGKNDLRMLGPIEYLARWDEQTGRYTAARLLHTRAVQIADAASPGSIKAVPALRGIARCFRLSYVFGEAQDSITTAEQQFNDPLGAGLSQTINAPSSDGERALRDALARLGDAPALASQRGAVLVDLGDWYLTAGSDSQALDNWRAAWKELSAAGDTSALDQPVAVVYHPPSVAVSQRQRDADAYDKQRIDVRLAIDASGKVRDASITNPQADRESAGKAVISAARRATWRPQFRNGEPVAVDDFMFHEMVYVKLPKPKSPG